MSKTVCITGCLGFIGSHITKLCLEKGWYVCGIDKITYAANVNLLDEFVKNSRFKFLKQDINDLDILYSCDYVINTAAETHVDNSISHSDTFLHSNINGVHNLLKVFTAHSKHGMPIFLQISTDEVYGDIAEGSHTEKDILAPSNPYSATKASADMLVLAWARTFKVPYIILRPTNNYGIGQYVEKLIPLICKCLLLDKKIPLHNRGTPRRVWLNAKDTANAVVTVIEKQVVNEIYNVSGNFETENFDVVKRIVKLIKNEDDPTPYCNLAHSRPGQDIRYSLDDSKIKSLGWKCECEFDKELPDVVDYYMKNFIW